ncbi:uncharacterized protein C8Q71DRAFT_395455 [Rhodofomes roseus]|uniref:DUF6534 domain-containing protein n=1 Tax=Rhodofomes roseus TaxID=34475 RepID=A0ABQ8JZU4_9APHY|nr:uncharacterized protein C8Q71DRAFT_395455 [Rhodofomes roseus]KAH9829637.1 hypothetical protein C8Q71DRAFT_395455 [Rhodofomes roseus]
MASFSIAGSLGSLFVGILLSNLLYGITCAQTLYYFYHYRDDRWILKTWVAYIWLLDTAKLMTEAHQLWFYFVVRHDNLFGLLQLDSFVGGEQILEGLLQLTVQWYFLHKIYRLLRTTRSRLFFAIPAAAFFVLSIASTIWTVYNCFAHPDIGGTLTSELDAAVLLLVASVVTDVYITFALCYCLQRTTTAFDRTKHIMSRLVTYLVNRGALLCVTTLVLLIMYCLDARNGTYYSEILQAPTGSLYANSLLAMLNVRNHLGRAEVNESALLPLRLRRS